MELVSAKILSEISCIIRELEIPKFLAEWENIQQIQFKPQFSVAVVGEFSRGKTTLLNQILEQDILPVGDLPTTAMISHIFYAPEFSIKRRWNDGKEEVILPEDVKKLVANTSGNDPEGSLYIGIPHTWLQENKVELLDTPGAGDLEELRGQITQEIIASCDATLVVISATLPLSLTEKSFVEEHIFQKKVPKVACVLTRLDQIKENERKELIKLVSQKIKSWSPNIELWSSYDSPILPGKSAISVAGPEKILEALSHWANSIEHRKLREQQVLAQTHFLLKKIGSHLLGKKAKLMGERDGNEELAKRDCERRKKECERIWKDLSLSMDEKEIEIEKWLEQKLQENLQEMKDEIISKLNNELEKNPKTQRWIESDFPNLYRKLVKKMRGELSNELEKEIKKDVVWLKRKIGENFSQTISIEESKMSLLVGLPQKTSIEENSWENSWSTQNIVWTSGIPLTIGIFFPPLGPILVPSAIIGGMIAKRYGLHQEKEIKKKFELELEKMLREMTDKIFAQSRKSLRDYYQKIIAQMKKEEMEYIETEHEAIRADYARQDNKDEMISTIQRQEKVVKNILKIISNPTDNVEGKRHEHP